MAEVTVSIALSMNELTRPILEGRFQPRGIRLVPMTIFPSEMFWRQLKFAEFDISEMSLSSLMIAASQGDNRFVALPIFTSRSFYHTRILVRRDRGVETPSDLKGMRIGVPEYQQTSAVWTRGALQHEFGVFPGDIQWFMERTPEKSHAGTTGFVPPRGVSITQIPATSSIGDMIVEGELDGTLRYLTDKNLIDRSRADISEVCRPLFEDEASESRRFFRKHGVFPINHTVVIKRDVLKEHPWAAINVFQAFAEAKREVVATFDRTLEDHVLCGSVSLDRGKPLVDPKPFGFQPARLALETLAEYLYEQGLTRNLVTPSGLFAPSVIDI
jgi:4,5-dihydroxyphthalate decarboxylase